MIFIESYIYRFKPPIGFKSQCEIEIYSYKSKFPVVLFKNIDGGGISVTNASEQLATDIVKKHKFEPTNCRFFETYPEYDNDLISVYDEVIYKWDKDNVAYDPSWKPEITIESEIIQAFKIK